jgi:hypothetical protein
MLRHGTLPGLPARTALGALVILAASTACSATLPVRTIPARETRWTMSVGGPIAPDHVATKVIPYVTAGAMHGVTDRTTVTGSVHLLAAALGVAGADVGVARRLGTQEGVRPEVTGQAQLYLFAGSGGGRVFPNVSGTLSWSAGAKTLLYTGASLTTQFSGDHRLIVSPSLGLQRAMRKRLTMQLESRWMAANIMTQRGLLEGESGIGGHGGFAVQLGAQVRR